MSNLAFDGLNLLAMAKVKATAVSLTNSGDPWYAGEECPSGFLSKRGQGGLLKGSSFKKRWFVLDGMLMRYFKSKDDADEAGVVHLSTIKSMNLKAKSRFGDESGNSVDDIIVTEMHLVGATRTYIIGTQVEEEILRWAGLIHLVIDKDFVPASISKPNSSGSSRGLPAKSTREREGSSTALASGQQAAGTVPRRGSLSGPTMPSQDIFSVVFDSGPLYLNIEARDADQWPVVIGFSLPDSGKPGPAQACGKINIGDVLVSVNGTSVNNSFTRALELCSSESWPRTMQFYRNPDYEANVEAEGWLYKQGDINETKRRRYFRLKQGILQYFRPARKTQRQDKPAGQVDMSQVSQIRPVRNLDEDADKQYAIELVTERRIWVLVAALPEEADYWTSKLSLCMQTLDHSAKPIPIANLKIVGHDSEEGTSAPLAEGVVYKLDNLTMQYRKRYVVIKRNGVFFSREKNAPPVGMVEWTEGQSLGSVRLMMSTHAKERGDGHLVYRIVMQKGIQTTTVAFADEDTMRQWAKILLDVSGANNATGSSGIDEVPEEDAKQEGRLPADVADGIPTSLVDEGSGTVRGWMWKRGEKSMLSEKLRWRKRYFVLSGYELHYYKFAVERGDEASKTATGKVDMRKER